MLNKVNLFDCSDLCDYVCCVNFNKKRKNPLCEFVCVCIYKRQYDANFQYAQFHVLVAEIFLLANPKGFRVSCKGVMGFCGTWSCHGLSPLRETSCISLVFFPFAFYKILRLS